MKLITNQQVAELIDTATPSQPCARLSPASDKVRSKPGYAPAPVPS